MKEVKVGMLIKVVEESPEHPFKYGEILTVREVKWEKVVWASNYDKVWGCLIPSEYKIIERKKTRKNA